MAEANGAPLLASIPSTNTSVPGPDHGLPAKVIAFSNDPAIDTVDCPENAIPFAASIPAPPWAMAHLQNPVDPKNLLTQKSKPAPGGVAVTTGNP